MFTDFDITQPQFWLLIILDTALLIIRDADLWQVLLQLRMLVLLNLAWFVRPGMISWSTCGRDAASLAEQVSWL